MVSETFIIFYNIIYFILFLIRIFIFIYEDEVYNNPNLHSDEQDDLEISDGKYCILWNHMDIFLKKTVLILLLYFCFFKRILNWIDIK